MKRHDRVDAQQTTASPILFPHLPEPLVPIEVDLSGFPSYMLNVERLLASELVALCTPEEGWAAFMLWNRAWQQRPPASLPDDDRVLAAFSKAGARWSKIRNMALRGFVKCSDGRLYHVYLAAVAKEAWQSRLGHIETVENKTDRQNRWRARVKETSEKLRKLGLTPPQGASLKTLEEMLSDAEKTSRVDDVDVSEDAREIGIEGKWKGSNSPTRERDIDGKHTGLSGHGTGAGGDPSTDPLDDWDVPAVCVIGGVSR